MPWRCSVRPWKGCRSPGWSARPGEDRGLLGAVTRFAADLERAPKVSVGKRLGALAEQVRTTDLGVLVTSYGQARLPLGWSWFEWDGRHPTRRPVGGGESPVDRVGCLAHAGAGGVNGIMHFAWSGRVGGETYFEFSALSDRDRGQLSPRPSHTTRHAGPHRAVREVEVT